MLIWIALDARRSGQANISDVAAESGLALFRPDERPRGHSRDPRVYVYVRSQVIVCPCAVPAGSLWDVLGTPSVLELAHEKGMGMGVDMLMGDDQDQGSIVLVVAQGWGQTGE